MFAAVKISYFLKYRINSNSENPRIKLLQKLKENNKIKQNSKSFDQNEVIVHKDPSSRRCKPVESISDLGGIRAEFAQKLQVLGLNRPRHNVQKGKLFIHLLIFKNSLK